MIILNTRRCLQCMWGLLIDGWIDREARQWYLVATSPLPSQLNSVASFRWVLGPMDLPALTQLSLRAVYSLLNSWLHAPLCRLLYCGGLLPVSAVLGPGSTTVAILAWEPSRVLFLSGCVWCWHHLPCLVPTTLPISAAPDVLTGYLWASPNLLIVK